MIDINPKIFKAYDLRGIYPTDLNEENIVPITRAIYAFFWKKLNKRNVTIAVGRDMRLSSPGLHDQLVKTLVALGAQVIDLGLVSTPTFYFAVYHYQYEAGIQITASHNPKDYNGLKFVLGSMQGLIKIGKPTGMEEIKEMAIQGVEIPEDKGGSVTEKTGIVDDEVTNALTLLENPQIKRFKIVADPANAMAILYLDALFKQVPADVTKMNFELDGTFPAHQADPLQPENLVDIQKKVLETHADLGLAPDGDGDRLFFIDEKGQVVPPSIIIGILSKELLKKNPGAKVVVDVKYNFGPRKVVEEYGGQLLVSKTGHAYITQLMSKTGALFAGEASSHFYYQATGNAESQVITIVSVLKILTEENRPLSQIAEEFRRSYESGEINFEVNNSQEIMQAIKEKYSNGEQSELDGIAVTYPTWRFVVRPSNTEPLLRLAVEAYDKTIMEEKRDELVNLITALKK